MRPSYICSPWVQLAIIVTALNDHVLKTWLPWPLLTGKLSDFAGLFFMPFFIYDLLSMACRRFGRSSLNERSFIAILLCVNLSFAALKLLPAAGQLFKEIYRWIGIQAHLTPDATDILACFMAPVALWHWRRLARYSAA